MNTGAFIQDDNIVLGVPGTGVWRGALAKINFNNGDLESELHTKWYLSLSDDVIRRGEQSVAKWVTQYYSYLGKFTFKYDSVNTVHVKQRKIRTPARCPFSEKYEVVGTLARIVILRFKSPIISPPLSDYCRA